MMKRIIRHKYNAKRTEFDGKKFDSKKEAHFYAKLKLAKESGELLFFLQQVPLDLPGGTKYRVDFVCFWEDGTVEFIDVKGFKTETYKLKKKQVEALYPIEIKEI